MADGTMSGGLEILNSAAKRSDQLRSLSFAPLRQLMPVENVSGGHTHTQEKIHHATENTTQGFSVKPSVDK